MVFFSNKKKLLEIDFLDLIEIQDQKYIIEVNFSKKKNSSVQVKGQKIIFRFSEYLSVIDAKNHFDELFSKILIKIQKSPINRRELSMDKIFEQSYFYFAHEKYLIERVKTRGVKLIGNTFYVNFHTTQDNAQKWFVKLLHQKYYERTLIYLHELNNRTYGYKIKGFDLKLVSSKWGHCTYDNNIMINIKLLNAPIEILDYVMIHELSHIRYKDHSKSFWNNVEKHCSHYKNLRKYLKEKPPLLFENEEV